jgi:transcriptional regulator with XRE-family HTH domain
MSGKTQSKVAKSQLSAMLKAERAKRGHTFREAAFELDCAIQSVANWESGQLPIKEKLPRLAAYIGIPPTRATLMWAENRKSVLRRRA